MASNKPAGYQPIALHDWKELLQSLENSIERFQTNRPQKFKIDAKSRVCLIHHYIADLEYCLNKAHDAIRYYEKLTQNYDRLISVMEESRNQAYDVIDLLKNEIAIAKEYRPLSDGEADKEESND